MQLESPYAPIDVIDRNIQISHMIYASQQKSTPTSALHGRRSRSVFPNLKEGAFTHGFKDQTGSIISPPPPPSASHPPSASSQSQFVVTTLRKSNLASTVDTKRTQQQNANGAFDQHFKKQTHLQHEKQQDSRARKVQSQIQTARDDPTIGVITNNNNNKVNVDKFIKTGQINQNVDEEQPVSQPTNNTTFQKTSSKFSSPTGSLLDSKVLETWINDMLVEAEFTQSDPKTKNLALKKYGIDRKTLRTKGLSQSDVDRVFRCLFVYSFGFYEMLTDILSHSIETNTLMAQIWKVFGVLLEYCSRGDFKSTVNELEREKRAQVEGMEQLLEEKETQLQALELKERDRHSKLLTDVNHLQQQRDMLLIEKTQIEEDFKQADMAFNDEVALRLKFEYRINEIHSIHRDLVAKHNKLLDDIVIAKKQVERLEKELQTTKRQVEVYVVDKRGLEAEINNLKIQIDNMQMALKGKDQQIRELDVKLAVMRKQENKEYFDRKDFDHQQQTLQLRITNLEGEVQASRQNESELAKQVRDLEKINQAQDKRINDLDLEATQYQKLYHETNSKFQLTSKLEKKLREQCESLRKEKLELDQIKEQVLYDKKRLEVDLQFVTQKADIQEREVAMLNQNIQQMKNIKGKLDDDYMRERVKVESLLGNVASKEDMVIELEKCLSYSQQRLHTVTTELNDLESKQRIKDDDFRVQYSGMQKKIDFLDICLMNEKTEVASEREKIIKLEQEIEYMRNELADVKAQFKTEVFEKNNLITKTIFMNRVIDNERQRNGELLLELTQLKITIENVERDNKALKVINQEQLEIAKEDLAQLRNRFEKQLDEYRISQREMTYKIYYEDALSLLMREQEEIRGARLKNFQLFQIVEQNEEQINKHDRRIEEFVQQIEFWKVQNQNHLGKLKDQRAIISLLKLICKKSSETQQSTQNSLLDTTSALENSQMQLNQQTTKLNEVIIELEKTKITLKRLRKEALIERGKKNNDIAEEEESKSIKQNSSAHSKRIGTADSDKRSLIAQTRQIPGHNQNENQLMNAHNFLEGKFNTKVQQSIDRNQGNHQLKVINDNDLDKSITISQKSNKDQDNRKNTYRTQQLKKSSQKKSNKKTKTAVSQPKREQYTSEETSQKFLNDENQSNKSSNSYFNAELDYEEQIFNPVQGRSYNEQSVQNNSKYQQIDQGQQNSTQQSQKGKSRQKSTDDNQKPKKFIDDTQKYDEMIQKKQEEYNKTQKKTEQQRIKRHQNKEDQDQFQDQQINSRQDQYLNSRVEGSRETNASQQQRDASSRDNMQSLQKEKSTENSRVEGRRGTNASQQQGYASRDNMQSLQRQKSNEGAYVVPDNGLATDTIKNEPSVGYETSQPANTKSIKIQHREKQSNKNQNGQFNDDLEYQEQTNNLVQGRGQNQQSEKNNQKYHQMAEKKSRHKSTGDSQRNQKFTEDTQQHDELFRKEQKNYSIRQKKTGEQQRIKRKQSKDNQDQFQDHSGNSKIEESRGIISGSQQREGSSIDNMESIQKVRDQEVGNVILEKELITSTRRNQTGGSEISQQQITQSTKKKKYQFFSKQFYFISAQIQENLEGCTRLLALIIKIEHLDYYISFFIIQFNIL